VSDIGGAGSSEVKVEGVLLVLSVALGLLLSGVSVLSVSMVSALVLLEGQRELKDGGCGE